MKNQRKIVLAITGASGVIYGVEFAKYVLQNTDIELHCIVSNAGNDIIMHELKHPNLESALGDLAQSKMLKIHDDSNFFSKLASGSSSFDAMIISPCSANTLGKLAFGIADNLISRVASVALKERRKLCLVLRETPLSLPILQSATTLCQAGAIIMPACPAFYSKEKTFEDLIKFVVGKSLATIGIQQNLMKEWNGQDTL
ncbi:MAG: UbiX family flavin prenyltransferase [Opitutales bacterium]